MALTSGTRLGVYEVTGRLGAGGMGEVYRAHDTRLQRDVALKVLLPTVANDPERLARFSREAQVLASLNHPHIAQIYGVEESAGVTALVLELLEGPTLADRIAVGAVPIDEALSIARQIAEALEAAHEQGIVHRDLKPANIKVRPDGAVKVLDFGLAKALEPSSGAAALANSPTITSPAAMTGVGMILGTAAYMSPEQAKGRPVDRRADLWAFGCVLYEMLTGTRAFKGDDVTETIAAVVRAEPDWSKLPANTAAAVRRLLRRCLEKDRSRRLSDAAVARLEIDDARNPGDTAILVKGSDDGAAAAAPWLRVLPWTVAGALAVVLATFTAVSSPWGAREPSSEPMRMSVELGAALPVSINTDGSNLCLSPDGTRLAFVSEATPTRPRQVYVRRLGELRATPLAGTEGARDPVFSPDGEWLAYYSDNALKKIGFGGGTPVTLSTAPSVGRFIRPRGTAWGDDGAIVFSVDGLTLSRVPSTGGTPEPLTMLADGESSHRWPQILPGAGAVLFTATTNELFEPSAEGEAYLVVQPLPTGRPRVIQRAGYYGRYLQSGRGSSTRTERDGHLVYVHEGTLYAAPFDLARLEITGPTVPAVEGLTRDALTASAQFTVSRNGTMAFLPDLKGYYEAPIHWLFPDGSSSPLRSTMADWSNPRFSPDGFRVAMDIFDGKQSDVWSYDWARDSLARVTSDPSSAMRPVWTPDGHRLAFASRRGDGVTDNLYWQPADGSTNEAQRLTDSKNRQLPASWHPSGTFLAFVELNSATKADIMILPMTGDEASGWTPGQPGPFLNTVANEVDPIFSPDGRWLSYNSDESGQVEAYVRPFPGPGSTWKVSAGAGNGGTTFWSYKRPELFYEQNTPQGHGFMVVPYRTEGGSFVAGNPRPWSPGRFLPRRHIGWEALHPDGNRIATALAPDVQTESKPGHLTFVFNFFDELRRLAPTK